MATVSGVERVGPRVRALERAQGAGKRGSYQRTRLSAPTGRSRGALGPQRRGAGGVERAAQVDPGRRLARGRVGAASARQAGVGEAAGGGREAAAQHRARAGDHGHGEPPHDVDPAAPAVEAGQVVAAHDPDEPHGREAGLQGAQGVEGVARADAASRRPRRSSAGRGRRRGRCRMRSASGRAWAVSFSGFCGETSQITRSSPRRTRAVSATWAWPSWAGLNEPPSRPTLMPGSRWKPGRSACGRSAMALRSAGPAAHSLRVLSAF